MKRLIRWELLVAAAGFSASLLADPPATQPAPPENPQVSVSVSARSGQRKSVPLPPPADGGVQLSLRDAISIALANNVDLDIAVAGAESSRSGILQAKGIFDPLVGMTLQDNDQQTPQASTVFGSKTKTYTGNLTLSEEVPTGGVFTLGWNNQRQDSNSSFYSVNPAYTSSDYLQLQHPLLRNFGADSTTRLIHLAKRTQDIGEQTFLSNLESTINSVEQAYWNLVYARRNLQVKQETKALAEELYRITKIKIDVGSQAPIDIVQTEAGVAQAELNIITARQAIGDAEDQLKRQLNFAAARRWNDSIIPTDEVRVEPVKIDADAGLTRALESRPEVRSALDTVESSRIGLAFSKNQTLPQLDLLANYGYAGLGGNLITRDPVTGQTTSIIPGGYSDALQQLSDRDFHNWTVGLTFSYPIFNRAARGARAAAEWNWESSKATLEQARQNISVQVRQTSRAIETARESIEAAAKNRELAEKNLDAEKKKYDNGLVTSYEVLQVQNDLSTARTAELQALTVYRQAMAAYHLAVGDMLTWKEITVDGLTGDAPPGFASTAKTP